MRQISSHYSFPFSRFFIKIIFLIVIILLCFWFYKKEEKLTSADKDYLYQYVKLEDIQYSNWSNWETIGVVSCSSKEVTCNQSLFCLQEEKIEKEDVNSFIKKYKSNKISIEKTGTKKVKVCKDNHYIIFNNTLYQVRSDYSNTNNWQYKGRFLYQEPPKDDLYTKYLYVGVDYSNCRNSCNGLEQYYFEKYRYKPISVADTNCENKKIEKTVDSYSYISHTILNTRYEKNQVKCYKKIRTRTVLDKDSLIWSHFDNQDLLDEGYQYTGKKKKRK